MSLTAGFIQCSQTSLCLSLTPFVLKDSSTSFYSHSRYLLNVYFCVYILFVAQPQIPCYYVRIKKSCGGSRKLLIINSFFYLADDRVKIFRPFSLLAFKCSEI